MVNTAQQYEILRHCLLDSSFLRKNRHLITESLFDDEADKEVAKTLLRFFDRYQTTTTKSSLGEELVKAGFSRDTVDEYVSHLFAVGPLNSQYLSDNLSSSVKEKLYTDLSKDIGTLIKEGKTDEISKRVANIEASASSEVEGRFLFADPKKALCRADNTSNAVPTGLNAIDSVLSGGPAKGTVNVILTPPNGGKTTLLINLASRMVNAGMKVSYFSLELEEGVIERRFLQCMLGLRKIDIVMKKKTTLDMIKRDLSHVEANSLMVKRFPSVGTTIQHINSFILRTAETTGFMPDAVFVDYASKMTAGKDAKHEDKSLVFSQLRDSSIEMNYVCWTAHQSNRSGDPRYQQANEGRFGQPKGVEKVLDKAHMSDAYEISAIVDNIISLLQSTEHKLQGTGNLFYAKARDDSSQDSVPVGIDWETCRIYDL
jgi:replicative DNA helicase